ASAGTAQTNRLPLRGQTPQQLHLPAPDQDTLIAAWIPYFTVESLLASPDEEACRNAVSGYIRQLRDIGINTVFLHVCAFGESYYPSEWYPMLPAANGHDAMRIFSEVCQENGVALHAWINPLRLQTDAYMESQCGDSELCRWYGDEAQRAKAMAKWDGRWYLDPAAPTTGDFLSGVVKELIETYRPAGIHIDDYFYPTAQTAWDAEDFAASGAENLAEWRRENINALMRTLYQAVHQADESAVFSVSPQGNIEENYERLFADTAAWAKAGDCCDLMIPQIYYGYQNSSHPFAEVLREWSELPRAENVSMAVGIAAYKVGQTDPYAGSGAQEWLTETGIPARQAGDVLLTSGMDGAAFYHADALMLLSPEESAALSAVLKGI
ncbi:MAG: family 10 glycosylhydrolase, partial [Oscillospiraceae bacterium]|nr:family 10 glycosylhydrolase [Oscillospiraceae bacterium]